MQGVCEQNIEELEGKGMHIETIFQLKVPSLKDHIGRVERRIKMILPRMIHHSI